MGDGSMTRDYIYVTDVTEMIATPAREPQHDVQPGSRCSVNEIVRTIEAVTGIEAIVQHVPVPPTFVQSSVLDMSRYEAEFGGHHSVSFADGIRHTYDYLKKVRDQHH